jgi:hypothetical protein
VKGKYEELRKWYKIVDWIKIGKGWEAGEKGSGWVY